MSQRTLLDQILEPGGLRVCFQPIVSLAPDVPPQGERAAGGAWQLHSLECLVRGPRNTNVESPNVLFEYVRNKRAETQVDRACVARILEVSRSVPEHIKLSVNVHASTLGRDKAFPEFLAECAAANRISPARIVVEIIEQLPFWDRPIFLRVLEGVRQIGVAIALDDVGLGHSNFQMMLDCQPNSFKIDRYLIQGINEHSARQAVLESIAQLARKLGVQIVAEGIEDRADLDFVKSLGISFFQGFYFSPPLSLEELAASEAFSAAFSAKNAPLPTDLTSCGGDAIVSHKATYHR